MSIASEVRLRELEAKVARLERLADQMSEITLKQAGTILDLSDKYSVVLERIGKVKPRG
jgi:uncharacterized coiled-coil protein SlyX